MIKIKTIYPEDIGMNPYTDKWLQFIIKMGYVEGSGSTWQCVQVIVVDTE